MEADGFWDRNQRFSYLVALENARRIRQDPTLIAVASSHLERFTAEDPRQAVGYALWKDLLTKPPEEITARLVERSEAGDYARQTAPSFGALPPKVRSELIAAARTPLAEEMKQGCSTL